MMFTACSMKMPEILSFGSSDSYEAPLKRGKCLPKKIEKDSEKLAFVKKK